MSAPACSTMRFVSLITLSALSFEQPIPTSWSGCPPIWPPVQPLRGLFGSTGFAPANCDIADTTPARSCWSNDPNAPWQSDITAILIGVPAALFPVAPEAAKTAVRPATAARGTSIHLRFKAGISTLFLLGWSYLELDSTRVDFSVLMPFLQTGIGQHRAHLSSSSAPAPPRSGPPRIPPRRVEASEIARSQMPTRPAGETSTITRKIAPISVSNRGPMKPICCE